MSKNILKVGTLTANYNNGKYFKECLHGILTQVKKPEYAVIVDDGSKDDSVSIIRNEILSHNPSKLEEDVYSIDGTKVVLLPQSRNSGPAGARNVGLKYLLDKVDAICIADSDDVLYPQKIDLSLDVMLKYPEIGLVYSDYDTYNEKTEEIKREFKEPFDFGKLIQECIVSNNSVIATSAIKIVGLYDESLFGPEDYDMWIRIAEVAAVYHIPKSLYKYRLSGNNITITTPKEKFAEHVRKVKQKAIARQKAKNG